MAFETFETPEERRRKMLGQQRQTATNASPLSRIMQGFGQTASGNMPSESNGAPGTADGYRPPRPFGPGVSPAQPPNRPAPDPRAPQPAPLGGNYTWAGPSNNGLQYPTPPPQPPPGVVRPQPVPIPGTTQPTPPPPGVAPGQPPAPTDRLPMGGWAAPTPDDAVVPGQTDGYDPYGTVTNDPRLIPPVINPGGLQPTDRLPMGGGVPTPTPEGESPWAPMGGRRVPPEGGRRPSPEDPTGPGPRPPIVPPVQPPNTDAWDTNGYAKPAYTAPNPGPTPPGWDPQKWANPNHQSPKYAVGRILSQFPPTVEGLQQAVADVAKAYPGATLVGRDKLQIPGVGLIDVLQGSVNGGVAWQWGDTTVPDPSGGEPPPSLGGPVPPSGNEFAPMGGGPGGGGNLGGGGGAAGRAGDPAMDEALKAFMRALGLAVPDAGGLKEASKENLLAGREAERESLGQRIQAGGLGRSGIGVGADAQLGEDFMGSLTKSYRDIDLASQQQGFNNLIGAGNALQGFGDTQFQHQFSEKQLEQNAQQFAQQMGFNWAQMSQQDRQFMKSYALNKWIAEQGNNLRILGL